jgi:hypothetical protein
MQVDHPAVRAAAAEALAGETDARRAVERLAAYTFRLDKRSPAVGQASAVEILRERCGDCSEHALLFVTLCRAAGIPARQCAGWACVGEEWGSHAWAEVWVGAWIGVDPTTDDVGTAARYLMLGYPDDPETRIGTVRALMQGRMRFVARRLEEGPDRVDLDDAAGLRVVDEAGGRGRHRLAGIDVRGLAEGWTLLFPGEADALLRGPRGAATVRVSADQGQRTEERLRSLTGGSGTWTSFAGAPALRLDGVSGPRWLVVSRKRIVIVSVRARAEDSDAFVAEVERVLAPTFAPEPPGE